MEPPSRTKILQKSDHNGLQARDRYNIHLTQLTTSGHKENSRDDILAGAAHIEPEPAN